MPRAFKFNHIADELSKCKIKNFTPEKLLELLFNNSVIGNHSNGKYYYKHREEEEPLYIDFSKEFVLNSGLTYYFNKT